MTDALTELELFELLSLECWVDSDGAAHYYNTDMQLHREHGPAVTHPDGYRAWWKHGQRHRIDGPAIEHTDGSSEWFINGKSLSYAEWQQVVSGIGTCPAITDPQ